MNKYLQEKDSIAAKSRGEVDSLDISTKYSFPIGKLNYTNLTKNSKPYAAVVSLSGEKGTFRDIQLAINYVYRQGGGIVFIRNGTYVVDQNLQLFSGVSLYGETQGDAIIDFNNGPYQVIIQGTLLDGTGTFSATNNSTTVTGSGTGWTSSLEGSYILIMGAFLLIDTVGSTTSITLASAYSGDNVSSQSVLIATPVSNVEVNNLTIQNSTAVTGSIYVQYARKVSVNNVSQLSSSIGMEVKNSDTVISTNLLVDSCGAGVVINDCANGSMDTIAVNNSISGDGISMTNANTYSQANVRIFGSQGRGQYMSGCYNYRLLNFTVISCTGIGLELSSSYDGNVGSGDFLNNTTDAIRLTLSNLRNTFSNLIIRSNGGWGINIPDSTNTNNMIIGDILTTNTSGSVNDLGTTTKIRSCIGQSDN